MFLRPFVIISAALALSFTNAPSADATSYGHAMNSQTYSVELNKTEIVRLPSAASAVVVGNPSIADVSVHSDNTIFVIGRSFGETNIVILDKFGSTVMDANVRVTGNVASNGVRVYSGTERRTYSCNPYCLPAPMLGDQIKYRKDNESTATPISNEIATILPSAVQNRQQSPGNEQRY